MNLPEFDHQLAAASVAAAGTVIGALIQLRAAWRKQVSERARGMPASRKSRRGLVVAVVLLLAAAGVGGFAFSQYLVAQSVRDSAALQGELKSQIAAIGATAERLERVSLTGPGAQRAAPDATPLAELAIAEASVRACRGPAAACAESDAQKVTLCASVPAVAEVTGIQLFSRVEGDGAVWPEHPVAPGQDLGRARFADRTFERADGDALRAVCTSFSSWDGEHEVGARLVVRFAATRPSPALVSQAALLPVTAAGDTVRPAPGGQFHP